jgi:hypothetical protein
LVVKRILFQSINLLHRLERIGFCDITNNTLLYLTFASTARPSDYALFLLIAFLKGPALANAMSFHILLKAIALSI